MHSSALLAITPLLIESLDARGIRWCVLRNYESFPAPRSDTSDLDILVDCPVATALELLGSVVGDADVSLVRVLRHIDGMLVGLVLATSEGPALRLDLASSLAWRGVDILPPKVILDAARLLPACRAPSVQHEAILMLMSNLLYRGKAKAEYREHIARAAEADPAAFLDPLSTQFGPALGEGITASARARNWGWFERNAGRLRVALALRGLRRHPLRQTLRWLRMGVAIARRWLHPPGLGVVFLGPDGAGKSTLGAAFRASLATIYFEERQYHFHWRPQLLPAPASVVGMATSGSAAGASAPHAAEPRGRLSSIARLLYFWLDYVLGYWLRVRPALARGGLVTFDRYYQDFLIDPRRYRLQVPGWLVRALGRLVPEPELVFVLDAEAAVLAARKQELTIEELERQLGELRALAKRQRGMRLVRVDGNVEQTVQTLVDSTRLYLDRRERRRADWPTVASTAFPR